MLILTVNLTPFPAYQRAGGKGVGMLRITDDRTERRVQKEFLKKLYIDYDPRRHDAFVRIYNNAEENKRLKEYQKNRGIE